LEFLTLGEDKEKATALIGNMKTMLAVLLFLSCLFWRERERERESVHKRESSECCFS